LSQDKVIPMASLRKGGSLNLSEMSDVALRGDPLSGGDYIEALASDYMEGLWQAVEKNAAVAPRFYILVTRRTMSAVSNNAYRMTFIGCHEKPQAYPSSECWYVDAEEEELTLIWTLPSKSTIQEIAETKPSELDPFLVKCCEDYVSGKLNRDQVAAAVRELTELAREDSGVQLARDARGPAQA